MKGFAITETEFDSKERVIATDVLAVGKQRSERELDEIVQTLQSNYEFFDIDERMCGFSCYDRRNGRLVFEVNTIETEYM